MTVMLKGRYTDAYLAAAGGQTSGFTDQELDLRGLTYLQLPVPDQT